MVREDGGADEALEDAEGSESECTAQHREEAVEERVRPTDLGEDEDDDLEDDEEAVHDRPEYSGGLIWHCAVPAIWCGQPVR